MGNGPCNVSIRNNFLIEMSEMEPTSLWSAELPVTRGIQADVGTRLSGSCKGCVPTPGRAQSPTQASAKAGPHLQGPGPSHLKVNQLKPETRCSG